VAGALLQADHSSPSSPASGLAARAARRSGVVGASTIFVRFARMA